MLGYAARRIEYIIKNEDIESVDNFRNLLTTVGILLYAVGRDRMAGDLLLRAQRGEELTPADIVDYVRPLGTTKFDKFIPWVFREFTRITAEINASNLAQNAQAQRYIEAANDLASVAQDLIPWQTQTRVDVMRFTLGEVVAQVKTWVDAQERGVAISGNVVYKFPSGWTVHELTNQEQLLNEGSVLRHCLRDPTRGYCERVLDGEIKIYSLRDARGASWATISLDIARNRIIEARGLANERPAAALKPYIDSFSEYITGKNPDAGFGRRWRYRR